MKKVFLGTVYTNTNKDHVCYACGETIKAGNKTRHDVWKEGQTVVNKYFCKTCENILDKQLMLKTEDGKPYNPEYCEFPKRFPHIYNLYFKQKYNIKERIEVIGDLQMMFALGFFAKLQYIIAHKIFGLKRFNGYKYRFNKKDKEEFEKTYNETKTNAYFLFDNA